MQNEERGGICYRLKPPRAKRLFTLSSIAPRLQRLLLLPSFLGLVAPLVALGWALLIATEKSSPLSWDAPLSLFLVVWFIYLADRLFDAFRADDPARLPPRHQFARLHWRLLGALMILPPTLLLTTLAPKLDRHIFIIGFDLALLTAIYFAVFRVRRIHVALPMKEITIGVAFAVGTFLAGGGSGAPVAIILCGAAMTALFTANCLIISLAERKYDSTIDPAAHFSSGTDSTKLPTLCLALAILLAGGALLFPDLRTVATTIIATTLLTFPILKKAPTAPDTTQPLADAVLLLPWITLAAKATLLGQ